MELSAGWLCRVTADAEYLCLAFRLHAISGCRGVMACECERRIVLHRFVSTIQFPQMYGYNLAIWRWFRWDSNDSRMSFIGYTNLFRRRELKFEQTFERIQRKICRIHVKRQKKNHSNNASQRLNFCEEMIYSRIHFARARLSVNVCECAPASIWIRHITHTPFAGYANVY